MGVLEREKEKKGREDATDGEVKGKEDELGDLLDRDGGVKGNKGREREVGGTFLMGLRTQATRRDGGSWRVSIIAANTGPEPLFARPPDAPLTLPHYRHNSHNYQQFISSPATSQPTLTPPATATATLTL